MFATKCAHFVAKWLHILWQTFLKFVCDNCDNVFTNFTYLKGHVKILLIDSERHKKSAYSFVGHPVSYIYTPFMNPPR